MNRRELLAGLVASAASCGVVATADVIEETPQPLLLVLHIDQHLSQAQRHAINEEWDAIQQKEPRMPQVVVLGKGMTLEAVLDPRVRPLPTRQPTWPPCTE